MIADFNHPALLRFPVSLKNHAEVNAVAGQTEK
jgi:hypothetical protein